MTLNETVIHSDKVIRLISMMMIYHFNKGEARWQRKECLVRR